MSKGVFWVFRWAALTKMVGNRKGGDKSKRRKIHNGRSTTPLNTGRKRNVDNIHPSGRKRYCRTVAGSKVNPRRDATLESPKHDTLSLSPIYSWRDSLNTENASELSVAAGHRKTLTPEVELPELEFKSSHQHWLASSPYTPHWNLVKHLQDTKRKFCKQWNSRAWVNVELRVQEYQHLDAQFWKIGEECWPPTGAAREVKLEGTSLRLPTVPGGDVELDGTLAVEQGTQDVQPG
ncbi:hypothetical protein B0H16DRAFT_1463321 [Mycena metata]|uniref:Uncharacterized protein n=1 Tax=Mycena metata TaxID=1033252 RepID=A0AAD7IJ65_9AGAR|nr:hypothetical protein B0H16DRAFT_1463321 [Mycena metata]